MVRILAGRLVYDVQTRRRLLHRRMLRRRPNDYKITTQEGLAVASIARDDPSTLPGDDPSLFPACTTTTMRGK